MKLHRTLFVILLLSSMLLCAPHSRPVQADSDQPVRIQYLGLASFLITAPDGTQIITDPFSGAPYPFPRGTEADVVTVSHNHPDHKNVQAVGGTPLIIRDLEPQQVGMVQITGYPSQHGGAYSGNVNIYVFQIGDMKIVHLGAPDVAALTPDVITAIQDADVVFVPTLSISLEEAFPFLDQIHARTMIPMHYSEEANARFYGAPTLEEFLAVVPADLTVVPDVAALDVTTGMPDQVVTMTRADADALAAPAEEAAPADSATTIQYLGISSVLITAPDGTRIITDPFSGAPYSFPSETEADIVTISHGHPDHNFFMVVGGDPLIIRDVEPQQIGMVQITGYLAPHGGGGGGNVQLFVFQIGDVKIVHLGAPDVSKLDPETLAAIQDADVVLVPMLAIPLEEIFPFMDQIHARTMIPMHYSETADRRFYGAPTVEEFLTIVPSQTTIVEHVSQLDVTAGMPVKVVVMDRAEADTLQAQ